MSAKQHEDHGVGTVGGCKCGGGGGGAVPDFAGVEVAAAGSGCAGEASPGELYGVDRARDCQLTAGEEEALMGYWILDIGYGILGRISDMGS